MREERMTEQVFVIECISYENQSLIKGFIETLLSYDSTVNEVFENATVKILIVIKPNWVQGFHELLPEVWLPVIKHPIIVLAVVERFAERLDGRGTHQTDEAGSSQCKPTAQI